MTTLATFSTAELQGEIDRRTATEAAETTRQLNRLFVRNRLRNAVVSARSDIETASAEHLKRRIAADERLQLGLHVDPNMVRNDEIMVAAAARHVADAQLRLLDAERALDAFDRQGA